MKKPSLIFIAFGYSFCFAQPVPKTMKHLPDSGQNTIYSSTYGEDGCYSIFPPAYVNNNNGTVTDTVTGLMWQQTDGGEMTFEVAKNYCDTLTLGGYTDWRLPSIHEGFSIMILDALNPALNTSFFTNTNAEYWWSKDKANNDTNKIWVTNAGGGKGTHPKSETISAGGNKKFHVRAVRDVTSPPIIPAHFTNNGDSTVTDNLTGLMWTQYPAMDSMNFVSALNYAEGLTLSGHTDWRLPNIKELASINNEQINNPSVDITYFFGVISGKYWSSTSQYPNGVNAWFADFQHYGLTSYQVKSGKNYVLAVRNSQGLNSIETSFVSEEKLLVYPNPIVNNAFLIIPDNFCRPYKLAFYNPQGLLLHEITTIENRLEIKQLELVNGINVLTVTDAKGNISSIKLRKN